MLSRLRGFFKPAAETAETAVSSKGRVAFRKVGREGGATKPPAPPAPTVVAPAQDANSSFKMTPAKVMRGVFGLVVGGTLLSKVLLNPDDPNSLINRALNPKGRGKYVLKIDKMDDAISGYKNTYTAASKGIKSALKNQSRYNMQREIGMELENVSDEQIAKMLQAGKLFKVITQQYTKQLEEIKSAQLEVLSSIVFNEEKRAAALAAAVVKKESETAEKKAATPATTTGTPAEEKKTEVVIDKRVQMEEKLHKLLMETVSAQAKAELEFMKQLESILSQEQRSKILMQSKPTILSRLKNVLLGLDSSKYELLMESIGKMSVLPAYEKRKVFVLTFTGDMRASQVKKLREEITAILNIADVKRGDEVVLNLNSGGGTVTGYGLGAAQLDRLRKVGLPLTVCIDEVAASGGYLMASVADKILASPFAILGSVGVIATVPNVSERLQREGISVEDVTAGKFKRTLTPYKKPTDEDRKKMKEDVESILVLFKTYLKDHRPNLKVDLIATGETWHGPQALEKGLIDGLQTSDDLLLTMREQGADVYFVSLKPIMPRFGDNFEDDEHSASIFSSVWASIKFSFTQYMVNLIQTTVQQTLFSSPSSANGMMMGDDETQAWQHRILAMDSQSTQYPPRM